MDTLSYFEQTPRPIEGSLLGGTYRLLRQIGRGGMGEVYEASHARLPGRFAVKLLLPELKGNREAFARFCREAEIMSELRHPNIVQVFDFNTAPDGRPYFVMEFLEGRDLETRLEEGGALPLPAVVRIVNAVASGLAASHAHGIVHRDLKPSNIFLATVNGQVDELVKVLDFGISKLRSAATHLSQKNDVLGTPPYMAPEQARGQVESVDGRTDQFALGAIAYRMLTGRNPFQGDDTAALLYQVVHEDPAPLARHVPPTWNSSALQAVLDRALAKDPAQRWGGMMEMARAFEEAAERTIAVPAAAVPAAAVPATTPAAADQTAEAVTLDEPPPVRRPVLRLVTPPPRPAPTPLVHRRSAVALAPRTAIELDPASDVARIPALRGSNVEWDLPSEVDRVPLSHGRAAALGVIALVIAGTMILKGWHREAPAAFAFFRNNFAAWTRRPMPIAQPRALDSDPEAAAQAGAAGGRPAAEAARTSVAEAAPSSPAAEREAEESRARARERAESRAARPEPARRRTRPSDELERTESAPDPRPSSRRSGDDLLPPTESSAGTAAPSSRGAAAPLPSVNPGGFSIAPPTMPTAPVRDFAPGSAGEPATTERPVGDQPLPPSP